MPDDYGDTAAIVMPVLWPTAYKQPKTPDLHCTLFFCEDLTGLNEDNFVDAIRDSLYNNMFIMADIYELDMFGPESDIPVVKIRHPLINAIHNEIEISLRNRNIPFNNKYTFNPHVTIDEDTFYMGPIPQSVWLRPVELWWRNQKIKILETT